MKDGGTERKLAVVVSHNAINASGMNVIVARLTGQERHRKLPSTVIVDPDRETGLNVRSYVLCHDLMTLPRELFDSAAIGRLPLGKLMEVENALRYSLDLGGAVSSR